MEYLKNFLGADIVFVTSEIPENIVIATPLNNLVAYYVDPADSEFVKAGLSYTTDSATGFFTFWFYCNSISKSGRHIVSWRATGRWK